MTNTVASVEFNAVTLQFQHGQTLLRNFSLAITGHAEGRGRIVAIMGPSGVGKSTLLQVVGQPQYRGLHVTHGAVTIRNAEVIAYVPQEPVLIGTESFEYNLNLFSRVQALERHWSGESRDRFVRLLKIEALQSRKTVATLSGGEKQRLMLARTLAVNPSIMLLDEPVNSLDQSTKIPLLTELRNLIVEAGILALYVTHDFSEARLIADDVLYLEPPRPGGPVEGATQLLPVSSFIAAPPTLNAAYAIFYPYFGAAPIDQDGKTGGIKLGSEAGFLGLDGQTVRLAQHGLPIHVTNVAGDTVFVEIAGSIAGTGALPLKRMLFPAKAAQGYRTHLAVDTGLYLFGIDRRSLQA